MANTFMCSIEEKLESEDKLPSFYKRYVDDTIAAVKDIATATAFLQHWQHFTLTVWYINGYKRM